MGWKHTEEAKQKIGDALRRPIEEDVEALRLVGQTTAWTFAERVGCSEQVARKRLNRLVRDGYAERFTGPRGTRGFLYVMTVPAGMTVEAFRMSRKKRSPLTGRNA
jgi:DNA-binding Lrp family transcriptional regulator